MKKTDLHIGVHSPLRPEDTSTQTYGCRANNPDICASNYLPGVCAFASEDCICHKPSRAWKKQYNKCKDRFHLTGFSHFPEMSKTKR